MARVSVTFNLQTKLHYETKTGLKNKSPSHKQSNVSYIMYYTASPKKKVYVVSNAVLDRL